MSDLLNKMRNEALSLPVDDRAKLAHELIISLDECIDSDVNNAWEAEKELWHAVDYYEDKVAGLGLDFEYEIQKALISIQRHPNIYTESKYGARRHLLHRFPYFIYYDEYEEYIWIIAFAHTSRKPFYWENRIS